MFIIVNKIILKALIVSKIVGKRQKYFFVSIDRNIASMVYMCFYKQKRTEKTRRRV